MRFRIAILMFLCAAMTVVAQEFTYVDWKILKADSFPTYYNEVIPLEENYNDYRYEVTLDYPEYKQLTTKEAKDVANWADSLPDEPQVNANVTVSRKKGYLDVSFIPIVKRAGTYYKLLSFKMKIARRGQVVKRVATYATNSAGRYADHSVLAQGRWVKIGITSNGVYRLTHADLQRMGFNDASRVKLYGYGGHIQDEKIDADEDFDDLEEVPLYRDGKGLLFYGKGLISWSKLRNNSRTTHRVNNYARHACYFLTEGDSPLTIAEGNAGVTPLRDITTTPATSLYLKEEFAWYTSGRKLYEAHNYAQQNSKTYVLETIDPVATEGGKVTVSFTASSSSSSSFLTTINGEQQRRTSISAVPSSYYAAMESTATFTVQTLRTGSAGTEVNVTSTAGVDARLGYIELNYTRQLKMTKPYLYMRDAQSQAGRFVINTNGRTGVKVWRLGRRGEPMAEMKGTLSGNTYQVPVADPSCEYVAVDVNEEYPSPTYIGEVANQDLHALTAADMVIIIPTSGKLYAQAHRLAEAHRSMDGMRVHIVRADQVYNEFSSGTPDATAYRRMMKMLYDRATNDADTPRYLLLFGDGVWDNRMLSSATRGLNPDDYLLCYEAENSLSHTTSYVMEDYFGLLDDGEGGSLKENKTDLGIGRFPVTTEAAAKIMVDKTIDYMQNKHAGSWKNVICVLGDDGDNNQHLEMAEEIATLVETKHPEMQVNRIHWDAYKRMSTTTSNTYPGVVADVKKQMDEGCLVMNYTGHGNPRSLSHEQAILLSDFDHFSSSKVPLWFTAACDVAPFDMNEDNIGEKAVLHPTGAAVAFVGTTRTVYATQNSMMNRHFSRYLLDEDANGRRNTIGDALRLAKSVLLNTSQSNPDKDRSENKLHYVLLGDPALTLGMPKYKAVIESVNGQPISDASTTVDFKAGDLAKIEGYIADENGNKLPDYTGVLTATVYDSESLITCLNNDGKSDEAFTFFTRDKRLYSGSDSIRNGRFSFSFPIPMDIKYSGEKGRIVLYAIDNDRVREANGYTENVVVGGSGSDLLADKEGPKITAYLNREDFVWGGTVNKTPYFVATLEDESGINTTSTAVGHDLELIIDNNPATTYILNSHYMSALGDYRKGQLAFVIPALPDGQHTLTFRAWDVMNNASTVTFDFNVDSKLSPDFISLTCSENPAREQTTFIVRYDRPGTECSFTLEVFDFAGRNLWRHTEKGTSADGIYPVTWNLTTSSGMPLSTGVYLYRVSVSTPDSKAVSRTNKIVILRNK